MPLSLVESIIGEDGASLLFHDRGRKDAAPSRQARTRQALPPQAQPLIPHQAAAPSASPSQQQDNEAKLRKWFKEHPPRPPATEAEKKADSFIDRFFSSSDKEQEGMEEEWDSLAKELLNEAKDSQKGGEDGTEKQAF